ncbi:MAG TPA: von Willebrand factor type A domain-containing protein [Chthoniobacteraceae bacterium]|jgi:Ca-activated chloride channel family protein|nr:von Willebrand factor type A domain-containing protein [Chthoniobacteraceae bacterium]
MQNEDPRLTAYALGELEPPERAEVEALLKNDPAAAAEVEEMRELAALVRRHLSTEEAPPLAPQQRDDILSEMSEPQIVVLPRNQSAAARRRTWMPVAIAACAAVLAGSSVLYYEEHKPRKVAAMVEEKDGDTLAPAALNFTVAEPQGAALSAADPAVKDEGLATDAPRAAATLPTATVAPVALATPVAASSLRTAERSKSDLVEQESTTVLGRAELPNAKRALQAAPAPAAPFAQSAPTQLDAAPTAGALHPARPQAAAEVGKAMKQEQAAPEAPSPLAPRPNVQQVDRLAGAGELTLSGSVTTATKRESQNRAEEKAKNQAPADGTKAAVLKPDALPPVSSPMPRDEALKKAAAGTWAMQPTDKSGAVGGYGGARPGAARGVAPANPVPDSNAAAPGLPEGLSPYKVAKAWDLPVRRFGGVGTSVIEKPAGGSTSGGGPSLDRKSVLKDAQKQVTETAAAGKAPASNLSQAVPLETRKTRTLELTGGVTQLALGDKRADDDALRRFDSQLGVDPSKKPAEFDDSEIRPTQPFALGATTPALPAAVETATTDSYDSVTDNPFLQVLVRGNETSTFSVDVDTASYSNVRRILTMGQRPPKGAVRIEELVNYFKYDYPEPKAGDPMSVNMDVADCPWTPEHRLLRVGLKARDLDQEKRAQANLIFLIDVSGSMEPEDRLPLVKKSLALLVEQLGPQDTVGIAVYAGSSGTVLEPTNDKKAILAALGRLSAGGSTNGGQGIQLAYKLAAKRFEKGRTNRVILATDGDFNVGITNQSDLIDLIQAKAKSGVFLTVLGFGYGNLKDSTMEKLADKGNGNYAYIDTLAEGRKVLVEQMAGTLVTVAKDVKLQIEFNPAQVGAYRLIGYENRLLAKEDFNDDTKDAGEVGAGHTVTALYEIIPAGQPIPGERETTQVDPLKYQPTPGFAAGNKVASATVDAPRYHLGSNKGTANELAETTVPVNELLTLKLRWKAPDGDVSTKREFPLTDAGLTLEKSSQDFRWAAAVAEFGMLLRDSPYKGQATWSGVRELAVQGQGKDADSHRIEFLELIGRAEGVGK